MDFDGEGELIFEELDLLVLGTEEEAVVVESDFPERGGCAGFLGSEGQCLEFLEEGGRPAGMGFEGLGGTGMDSDCGVTDAI